MKFKAHDLPKTLPVFPLSGALLLPRTNLPLKIFEPRYLAMLDDALKSPERLIGIVQPLTSDAPQLQKVGCVGRITSFRELKSDRYLITLSGVARFSLDNEIETFTAYRRFGVTWAAYLDDLTAKSFAAKDSAEDEVFFAMLRRYFKAERLAVDWKAIEGADPEQLVNSLAMICPFQPNDKQALLEAPTLPERRKTLYALIEFALYNGSDKERMQ
ncbi:MAG: LON peptidase substrate-binding domain-containing protein [Rhodobacteraceae bacterium]|nr:LON peptidase substrate-binding domain-containing protein [Paracoccaceae bacterium]